MAVTASVFESRTGQSNDLPYQTFMKNEGIPVHEALIGVDDLKELPRAPWARTGAKATFVELLGTFQSERGIYVAEIAGAGALEPEKHLYEEEIFILGGRGTAQVWQGAGEKITFEWGPGSVFAFPPNTTHRLLNGAKEPVIFMGVTTAPRLINAMDNLELIFESDFPMVDLYGHGDNYFLLKDEKRIVSSYRQGIVYTNFIPDARRMMLDDLERKVAGGQLTGYRMGKHFPRGHVSEWPAGRYHKAHYHGPGAILLGLDGEGYVLAWDARLGPRPYQSGHGDQVYKVNWTKDSIYVPPNEYFHQHLNSGPGPAKHIAVYGARLPMGARPSYNEDGWSGMRSTEEGGTLIEYEDEDPQVRLDFEDILHSKGIECNMPPVTYR